MLKYNAKYIYLKFIIPLIFFFNFPISDTYSIFPTSFQSRHHSVLYHRVCFVVLPSVTFIQVVYQILSVFVSADFILFMPFALFAQAPLPYAKVDDTSQI
jgi:hypothetical protein